MSQTKTTRAFRTISEAGEELGLQPHVLRFWESKFSDIKPIKRGGGRRFYRPEDIEFIRGIKKLLHDEKHPIKDVQKLIKKKGSARVVELGRSLEKAAREMSVTETDLLPKRIKPADRSAPSSRKPVSVSPSPKPVSVSPSPKPVLKREIQAPPPPPPVPQPQPAVARPIDVPQPAPPSPPPGPSASDRRALQDALKALEGIKGKMSDFRNARQSD